uniref:Integrase catalytic domain-containing protein n=1 Tax=Tanacetum cinerariifolium TaxID=118510 RepID=A0A699HDL4_TANCI|nr:hypothetical protein [Tanacetum cinerariifolium]
MVARGQNHGKGKNKLAFAPKPKIPPPPKKEDPVKDSIVMSMGLRESRKLKSRALSLYVGNGQRETIEAIDIFYLCLTSGLEIVLNNFHYALSITRGVISISCLYENGFINRFMNNTIQVSRNNIVYFSVIPRVGIFEIDLSNSYTNESSIYVVSNKRAKLDLDSTLLWHCRLGHISKKRIEKLQHDRLLNSTDLRAFEKYVPCMSRKMEKKPYTHQVERAKDLLGLIHTDVCGPVKIMSRQGANYFVTFTDDFSRYGYVYLLKHKHEVFETFKVFQKEVENQLGKTIKSLRCDREGEYMSQEFLDHLKDHGIIAHRTPPYTAQYNGVSERRNRTLLDMVRSMMIQTTLRKSLWDYALETAARILNMVPTKKVEKTPYKASGSLEDLEIIQEEDTHPSIDTSLNHKEDDQEINKPQSDIVPIHRSTRTRHALDRMCLYIDAEEHELGDLEPLVASGSSKKTNMDRVLHTYKAHLVANGYTQTPGIDYEETFSPVVDIRAIRILIAIAAYYVYEIWQIDIKTAFLNGYLNKDVYMEQPEASGRNITFLILYVNDILIMGNNIPMLQDVKSYLEKCFSMKDLVEAAYILGIKIYRDRSRRLIGFCQSAYIKKILKRYYMENSKRGSILMQEKLKLSKSQCASTPAKLKRIQNVPYASVLRVSCYTNAGYLTDADDLKSYTGYVFVLNGGVVDWKSVKQSIFATSSTEDE